MPDIPNIAPLLITGVMIGSILRTTKAHVSWRFIIMGSLLGGLGNVANAVLLYLSQGQQTRPAMPQAISETIPQVTPPAFAGGQMISAQSLASFVALSFIVGAFMILLVFVAARLTVRIRGRKSVEEEEQQPSD